MGSCFGHDELNYETSTNINNIQKKEVKIINGKLSREELRKKRLLYFDKRVTKLSIPYLKIMVPIIQLP